MFERTSNKLAALYLVILMGLSIAFSLAIYQVSLNEIGRGLRGGQEFITNRPFQISGEIEGGVNIIRQVPTPEMGVFSPYYKEARSRLIQRLVLVNLLILLGGGFLCHYLARKTLEPIEESHASLERFTADASHELRTPIAVMQSEIEVALMDPKLTLKDAKTQLNSNLEELARLTSLTEGLLKLSQVKDGKLEFSELKATELATAALARSSGVAAQSQVTIKNEVTDKKLKVKGDKSSLTEALVILLDNAVKYSPAESEVVLKVVSSQKYISFSVADKGVGVSTKDQAHIFERFYRADTSRTSQKVSGYGLGLAIAKNIVDQHGGRISVKSQDGKGSTFTIDLPV